MTSPKIAPTTPGDDAYMRGRFSKAKDFLESAEALFVVGSDAGVLAPTSVHASSFVDLCVNAGIAAGDAICIKRTGRYSSGGDHNAAVAILKDATDRAVAKNLDMLIRVKSKAAYSARAVDASDIHNAGEAARALVDYARDVI
jgi:hypothetical protein